MNTEHEQETRTARDRLLFERIAATYANKDLHRAQRTARAHRLNQTLAAVTARNDLSILEVGCGAGFAATYLKGRYQRYVGVDHSAALVEYARRHNAQAGAEFHAADIGDFEFARTFDLVFMIGVLHHLSDPVGILGRLRRFLNPGGVVAVNEPHRGNPVISVARAIRKRTDSNYSEEQTEYTGADLHEIFAAAGYRDISSVGQGVLSTPFAEVVTPLQRITAPLSRLCCAFDTLIERRAQMITRHVSWNLVVTGSCGDEAAGPH